MTCAAGLARGSGLGTRDSGRTSHGTDAASPGRAIRSYPSPGPEPRAPAVIDSHCHLAGEEFVADRDAVIARARDAGVDRVLVILAAEDDAECVRGQAIAEAWPAVRFAVGVHPHQAHQFAADPAGGGTGGRGAARQVAVGAGHRRDRARLPLRLLAAGRPAGGLPRPARARAGTPTAGRDSHARGRGRHPAAHRRGAGARATGRRVPLLHRGRRRSPGAPSPPASCSRSPGSSRFRAPSSCGKPSAWCRSIGCWWKPTPRTWRRSPTAASATSRRMVAETLAAVARARDLPVDDRRRRGAPKLRPALR